MTLAIKAHLLQERRRLAFVTSLAFLAGWLFFLSSSVYVGPVHISLVTGAFYALIVGVSTIAICTFVPRFRFMIEAVAVARFVLALALLASPELTRLLLGNPLLMAFAVVTLGTCVSRAMHGTLERETAPARRFGPASRHTVTAHGSPWQRRFVAWVDGTPALRPAA